MHFCLLCKVNHGLWFLPVPFYSSSSLWCVFLLCVSLLLCSLSVRTNSAISHLFCVLCHCEEKQQQSCQLAKDRWRSFLPVQHKRKYNCKNRRRCKIICRISPYNWLEYWVPLAIFNWSYIFVFNRPLKFWISHWCCINLICMRR